MTAVIVVATATLATATVAESAQRYAAPAGTGTACTQIAPCDLDTAVEDSSVDDGDEVIVTPGSYTIVDLFIANTIQIHGQSGQALPTINTSGPFGINVGGGATVSDLRVEATGSGINTSFAAGATLERLFVHHSATAGPACSLIASSTLRDSVCWSSSVNSSGVGANVSFGPAATIRLRNVTAIGTAFGMDFSFSGGSNTVTVDAKNVIAKGGESPNTDVHAIGSGGANTQIVLDHSNYATELEVGTTGGTASITDPGTGTNQTAVPAFVDASAGDFHQISTSPTVDAGALDAFTGSADFEGDPRSLDGDGACPVDAEPDIGADELTPEPDCDPPDTTIVGGPTGLTNDPTPTFGLQSDELNSIFECSIDNGAFSPCTDPYTTSPLPDGPHTLDVQATDANTNVDPTPAHRAFTVDATAPGTTISGGPTGTTADRTPTFTLGSEDPSASLECKIDSAGFTPCDSPYTTPALGDGQHTLSVHAIDAAGNEDPTPATRTFRVDATAPQTTITAAPKPKVKTKRRKARVSLSFAANEPGRFECSLDGAAFTACSSPQAAKVGKGKHVWAVRAIDRAGNADGSPAQAKFTVKRKRKRR
jgi:hypothetical protein